GSSGDSGTADRGTPTVGKEIDGGAVDAPVGADGAGDAGGEGDDSAAPPA
ncbi:MAG: hypothetical protein JWN54_3808, partial [Mycobacterium sp.]|nr:hypothetical protein [Mycobacterium sp.]